MEHKLKYEADLEIHVVGFRADAKLEIRESQESSPHPALQA